MSQTVARSQPLEIGRWSGVDAARGLAILLMVLDHLLVVLVDVGVLAGGVGSPSYLVRMTVTRASLPLFMLCTGGLLSVRRLSWLRFGDVSAAALVVNGLLIAYPIGIHPPEVLAVWCLVMVAWPWIGRYPALCACVGIVQVYVWPIGWQGYQPGVLLVLVSVGVLAGPGALEWATRLPMWLGVVGRKPLVWYCGHLVALAALHAALA